MGLDTCYAYFELVGTYAHANGDAVDENAPNDSGDEQSNVLRPVNDFQIAIRGCFMLSHV